MNLKISKSELSFFQSFQKITQREIIFQKNISDYENYLASEDSNIRDIVEREEKRLNNAILKGYDKLDTQRIDGIQKISQNQENQNIFKKLHKEIDKSRKNLKEKLISSPIQDRLFDKSRKMAEKTLRDDEKLLQKQEEKFQTLVVNEIQFQSFKKGYVSNVSGVLFNEPRRYHEMIDEHYGSGVSIAFAKKQVFEKQFNKNVLTLSTLTHPRASFNGIMKDGNEQRNVNNFKIIVPKNRIKDLKPEGMTASLIFKIFTVATLLEMINKDTNNPDPISGLNIHHGGFVYYYPISDSVLEEEEKIAKEQRSQFLENK